MTDDKTTTTTTTNTNVENEVISPEEEVKEEREILPFWKTKRYIVVLMIFFGLINVNILKTAVSVAVIAMTENRTGFNANGRPYVKVADFNWNSAQKGYILSSYFYGYMLSQFAAGFLGAKIGGAVILSTAIGMASCLTLLTPLTTMFGFYFFLCIRTAIGFCAGVTVPCVFQIYSQWIPRNERARTVGIGYCGYAIGTIICTGLSGILADKYGWQYIYYVFGVFGLIWYGFWIQIVTKTPAKNKNISDIELRYIEESLDKVGNVNLKSIPWKAIFTSPVFYSLLAAMFAEYWGYFTMLLLLPSFLHDVLKMNLRDSGIVSALPYFVYAVLLPMSGYISDKQLIHGYLTATQIRKYSTCVGFLVQGIFLILAVNLTNGYGVISCVILAISLGSFPYTSFSVNFLDIAPQYTSILLGICTTFSSLAGIVSPTITGFIVQNQTKEEWSIVFYITSVIYFIGMLIFWLFSSAELQSWAKHEDEVNTEPHQSESNTGSSNSAPVTNSTDATVSLT